MKMTDRIIVNYNPITGEMSIPRTGTVQRPQQSMNTKLPQPPYIGIDGTTKMPIKPICKTKETRKPETNTNIVQGTNVATEKTYQSSTEILNKRQQRKTKQRAIQSAREHQRNQKQMLLGWFIQSNQLSLVDFYELTMDENHHISRERLEMACKRAYNKEQQQRFADCMRSLYHEK